LLGIDKQKRECGQRPIHTTHIDYFGRTSYLIFVILDFWLPMHIPTSLITSISRINTSSGFVHTWLITGQQLFTKDLIKKGEVKL
jgi:hypothetical protein